jgi:hypothetical protein
MCPLYTVKPYAVFFENTKLVWGGLIIPLGVIIAFLGRKLLYVTSFFISMSVFEFTFMLIFSATFMDGTKTWVTIVTCIATALGALGFGALSSYFIRFGSAMISATAGFLIGVLLNVAWFYYYNQIILSYAVMAFFAALFFGITWI